MAQDMEPMEVDCIDSEFDNKENTFHHSNMLPCTEKGYEELDVSELNMKLRYSITPAASPMSKSYNAYTDNKNLESDDSLNCTIENNLTRSLNSTITKHDSVIKSLKTLPLQSLPTDQMDSRNSSVLRPLDTTITDSNVTVTISEAKDIDETLSLPSTSSSMTHTPEATTPVNDLKIDGGSPIMRGLKSVLNMFRPSQSPIPPADEDNGPTKPEASPSFDTTITETNPIALASTPIAAHPSKERNTSRKSSPLKDSIVFNDDLEKELQWKDETTIIFSQEKIPIHKLFYQNGKPLITDKNVTEMAGPTQSDNIDTTLEYMDISCNDSVVNDKILSQMQTEDNIEVIIATESDGEFEDCETNFTNNESYIHDKQVSKDPLLGVETQKLDSTHDISEITEIIPKQEETKPNTVFQEDTNSTISIIQELDSLLEQNNSKKETSCEENIVNTPFAVESTEESNKIENSQEIISDDSLQQNKNINDLKLENVNTEHMIEKTEQIAMKPENSIIQDTNHQALILETCLDSQQVVINEPDVIKTEMNISQVETPADVPLPDEDDIEFKLDDTLNTTVSPAIPDIIDNNQNEAKLTVAESLEKSFNYVATQDSTNVLPEDSGILNEVLNTTQSISSKDSGDLSIDQTVKINKEIKTFELNDQNNIDVNEYTDEVNVLPDVISQTAPSESENVPILLDDKDKLIIENKDSTTVVKTIEEPVLNEIQTIPSVEQQIEILPVPIDDNIDTSMQNIDTNESITSENVSEVKQSQELLSEPVQSGTAVETMIQSEVPLTENENLDISMKNIELIDYLPNITYNLPISNQTVDEQVVTLENITHSVDDNFVIPQENVIASVTIDEDLNNEITNPSALLNVNDVTKDISVTDAKISAPENNENLTVIVDDKSISVNNESNMSVLMKQDTNDLGTLNVTENSPEIPEILANSTVVIEDNQVKINTNLGNCTVIVENALSQVNNEPEKTNQLDLDKAEVNTQVLENISEPLLKNICDSENTDVEVIVSENSSPYVSVMAGIDTEPKLEDNFETVATTFSAPNAPSSPPIVSKGYNFNFDELDDPFATKTKIRLSPPPNTPSKDIVKEDAIKKDIELPKKAPMNRRKSQPPERKRAAMNKKKFNSTFDGTAKVSNETPKPEKEVTKPEIKVENIDDTPSESQDSNQEAETDKEVTKIKQIDVNTQALESEAKETVVEVGEKSSCESSTTFSEVKTTSSEQSYFSAAGSSTESFKSKNVFNIPEIHDANFNPFATKSKMRESPPLVMDENPFASKSKLKSSPDCSMISVEEQQKQINDISDDKDKMDVEMMEKDAVDNLSKASDEKNITREVHTEDEDTEEGPFLEAEDSYEKTCILADDNNLEPNILQEQINNNLETGEVFIDAEAFEFFLNQNQSNMVADSGKESLFLKFDPLFAKRISSNGVVAALNNIQKKQSTPTKTKTLLKNEASPIAGPSNLNATYENDMNVSLESNDEANITVSKPTMKVTPAVNPVVTPRNKSITPNRSNRRSITFTSPAMAVIDRLLSMSANNSLVDTTMTQQSRDQHEADAALSQLRDLLAEKEIHVYNLRSESMLLKERLTTMESQVKTLEAEGQERLKKINDMNTQLLEKAEMNKRMADVVEEYERTIASLIAETEQDKKRHAEERIRLINERDEQTAHLASMEVSFSDLHSKYEKSKQIILSCKANEETYKKSINDFEESLKKMQSNYEMLKQHATSKLNHANSELEKMKKAHEAEVLKLNALLKRKELHITSLEETLTQKTKANDELTAICDELINKVG